MPEPDDMMSRIATLESQRVADRQYLVNVDDARKKNQSEIGELAEKAAAFGKVDMKTLLASVGSAVPLIYLLTTFMTASLETEVQSIKEKQALVQENTMLRTRLLLHEHKD